MFRLTVWAATAGIAALALGACTDSTGPAPGNLASVTPAPAATAVSAATTITLAFGQPMMAGMEQFLDLHQGGIAGPVVPMTCVWSLDATTVTCTPTSPLAGSTQFTIHVGAGMTDPQDHMIDMDAWTMNGGQWATTGMMGGTHAGQPVGMMGAGWKQGTHFGMLFGFTTS